jgi:hypothetical protein
LLLPTTGYEPAFREGENQKYRRREKLVISARNDFEADCKASLLGLHCHSATVSAEMSESAQTDQSSGEIVSWLEQLAARRCGLVENIPPA